MKLKRGISELIFLIVITITPGLQSTDSDLQEFKAKLKENHYRAAAAQLSEQKSFEFYKNCLNYIKVSNDTIQEIWFLETLYLQNWLKVDFAIGLNKLKEAMEFYQLLNAESKVADVTIFQAERLEVLQRLLEKLKRLIYENILEELNLQFNNFTINSFPQFNKLSNLISDLLPFEFGHQLARDSVEEDVALSTALALLENNDLLNLNSFKVQLTLQIYWKFRTQNSLKISHHFAASLSFLKSNVKFVSLPKALQLQMQNAKQALPPVLRILYFSSSICLQHKATTGFYLMSAVNSNLSISFGVTPAAIWSTFHGLNGSIRLVNHNTLINFHLNDFTNLANDLATENLQLLFVENNLNSFLIKAKNLQAFYCLEAAEIFIRKLNFIDFKCYWQLRSCS